MHNEESGFKLQGIAIVAVDKPLGTDWIEYYPVEHLYLEMGDPSKSNEEVDVNVVDINGISHRAKLNRKAVLKARWYADGDDSRQTAPDVINGETVHIYRYMDSEEYYWKTIFREPALRRKEHVVYAYGNIASGRSAWDSNSSYGQMWSTHDKKILFWTSQSDGEAYRYSFTINTNSSEIREEDNVGNIYGLHSPSNTVYMRNSPGTLISTSERIAVVQAAQSMNIDTPIVHMSEDLNVVDHIWCDSISMGYIRMEENNIYVPGPQRIDTPFNRGSLYGEGGHGEGGNSGEAGGWQGMNFFPPILTMYKTPVDDPRPHTGQVIIDVLNIRTKEVNVDTDMWVERHTITQTLDAATFRFEEDWICAPKIEIVSLSTFEIKAKDELSILTPSVKIESRLFDIDTDQEITIKTPKIELDGDFHMERNELYVRDIWINGRSLWGWMGTFPF